MNKPMTREQAEKLVDELICFVRKKSTTEYSAEWLDKVLYYKRLGRCRRKTRDFKQRIIKAMAPEPVVITEIKTSMGLLNAIFQCPKCGMDGIFIGHSYCPFCGSKITWQLDTEDTDKSCDSEDSKALYRCIERIRYLESKLLSLIPGEVEIKLDGSTRYICPDCEKGLIFFGYDHCPKCGVKIIWKGGE